MEYLGVMVKTEPVEADSDQDLQEDGTLPLHDGGGGGVAHTMDHPHDDTPATFQIKLEPDVDEETTTSHCDVPRTMMMMSEETGRGGRGTVMVVGQSETGQECVWEEEAPVHDGRMIMTKQTRDDDDGDDLPVTFEIKLEKDVPEEKEMSRAWKTTEKSNQTQDSIQPYISNETMRNNSHVCPECPAVNKTRRNVIIEPDAAPISKPSAVCSLAIPKFSGDLKAHMQKHGGEKQYSCTECKATFTLSGSLKRHMQIHSGEKPYSCTECEAKFTQSGSLKRHMRIHNGGNLFTCTECEATFAWSSNLTAHMRIHRGEKPFACTDCEAAFTHSGDLKKHMRRHRGERPYSCTECEATFTVSGSLKVHMRRHRGEKPYACTECEATFTHSSTLKAHMGRHKGEKPYSCTECEAKFTQSGNLKVHMRKHSGEKPYTCTECQTAFTRSHHLKRHMKIHRGVNSFCCTECEAIFTSSDTLNAHMQTCSNLQREKPC